MVMLMPNTVDAVNAAADRARTSAGLVPGARKDRRYHKYQIESSDMERERGEWA